MSLPESVACTCGVRMYELLQLQHGELDAAAQVSLQARVQSCEICAERLARFQAEQQAFLQHADVALQSAQILARLEAAEAKPVLALPWRVIVGRLTAAVAMVLAVLFALPLIQSSPTGPNRTKGGPAIEMYVDGADAAWLAEDGIELTEGDRIQFRYSAGGYGYLMVVSLDGTGAITSLYPSESGESLQVDPGGTNVLQGSIILDDAIGTEQVYALFTASPLVFEEVRQALRAQLEDGGPAGHIELDRLDPDLDVRQVNLHFEKVAR